MNRLIPLACALALTASCATAQQLTTEQSIAATLGQQIGLLTYENGQLRAQLMDMSKQLSAALKERDELKGKLGQQGKQ